MTAQDYLRDFIAELLPGSLFSCKRISMPEYSVNLCGTERRTEIRIVQVSDLHSNDYGGKDGLLVRSIRELRPDLIVMTGDIFDKDMGLQKSFGNVRELMEGIGGLCPSYYVTGNHEFYADEGPFLSAIASYGATVLSDEATLLRVCGSSLVLAGLSDPLSDLTPAQRLKKEEDDKPSYLRRLEELSQRASGLAAQAAAEGGSPCPCILLAHRPEYIEYYASCGFDLIFSGHAHGGQWIIPGQVNGIYAVGQGFFPRYAGGLYEIERKAQDTAGDGPIRFIVSRGLSYQKPAFPRFGNPPELPIVRLFA